MYYENRNYNSQFIDTMDEINNIGKGRGFRNGIDWAEHAQKAGQISYHVYKAFHNCHDLRIRFAHGNARDVSVTRDTYGVALKYLNTITTSRLRKSKNKVELPYGTYRSQPFIKEFNYQGQSGRNYNFKFKIVYERNYLDDGFGGTYGTGYFIHILRAPYYDYALENLHTFHIIRTSYDNHICWNKVIDSFREANAVMFVWVKRYVAVLEELYKNRNIEEDQLMKRVNKTAKLPAGTFRHGGHNGRCKKKRKPTDLFITREVYEQIMDKLGTEKPELGGMLGWKEDELMIDTFVFDKNAQVSHVEYTPNVEFLNGILQNEWERDGVNLAGFVHSHPNDFGLLSQSDIDYARRIMETFDLDLFVMPIVTSAYEFVSRFNPYIIRRSGRIERCRLKIVESEERENELDDELLKSIESAFDAMDQKSSQSICEPSAEPASEPSKPNEQSESSEPSSELADETFARISSAIDLEHMSECTVIGIGCGGARGFYEDMARVGVGRFYLIDGDVSSRSNIASQNGFISEIGKPKPEAVKNRLLDINDKIEVCAINRMLDDSMTDEWIESNILDGLDRSRTVICAFTDDFFAQARATELSLKYGIPYLAAQHHLHGDTSELIYWYPGISQYTPKDILKSRYEAYDGGYKNDVTSVGSPIFNTTRLNAICSKIATGILLCSARQESIFSSFLTLKPHNNLLLIRQKHLAMNTSGLGELFYDGYTSHFDDILWLNPSDLM